MKNRKLLFLLAAIVVCLIATIYCFNVLAGETPDISAQELKAKTSIEISDCTKTPKIDKSQAIEKAKKAFADLAESKNIKAQLNTMTYSGFTNFSEEALAKNPKLKESKSLNKTPVWIVSFKGLKILRSGGASITDEQRVKTAHQEENVVVDAMTGEPLFSFTFR